jgi:alkanesulfonate monooxygenase SsuD/methylene tetrahydromethanopterin reductase-like flavin-dependent oxidoreductase (luciferase family)
MRLGVFGINGGSTYGPEETTRLAQIAEAADFDSVWAGEHVVVPSPRVVPSPMEPDSPNRTGVRSQTSTKPGTKPGRGRR